MSFAPSPRQYRPIRPPRRLPIGVNHPDPVKRFKPDDQTQASGGFYQQQQSNANQSDNRFNGPTSNQISTATSDQENNVLLFTIMNAAYPITVDVMKAICSAYGQILRIVIFRKNGVQALVEFDALTSARSAKDGLQGADIYSGCCSLKIDYAKSKRLNVIRNDNDNFDCELVEQEGSQQQQQGLLPSAHDQAPPGLLDYSPRMMRPNQTDNRPYMQQQQQPSQYGPVGYYGEASGNVSYEQQSPQQNFRPPPHRNDPYGMGQGFGSPRGPMRGNFVPRMDSPYGAPPQHHMYPSPRGAYGLSPSGGYYGPPQMMGPPQMHGGMGAPGYPPGYVQQCVILVNNLTCTRMNCDLLFNFLCVYGNVLRIKFLKSREGCAMVQMSQADPLNMYMREINNAVVFGNRIGVSQSKQEYLEPVMKPFSLPDGQPSYKDFSESRANRYSDPKSASRNRPTAPSITLYYFNTPPDFTEEDVCKIFDAVGAKRPSRIKNFAAKKNPDDSRLKGVTGLAQWETISDTAETLILCNNHQIEHPSSKWPYIFKVTFSAANMPAGAVAPDPADPVVLQQNEEQAGRCTGNYGEYSSEEQQYEGYNENVNQDPAVGGAGANAVSNNNQDRLYDAQSNDVHQKGGN